MLFAIGGGACYAFALHYANTVYDGWLFDSAKSLALVVERTDHGVILDLPQSAVRLFVWDVSDTTYYRVSGSSSGFIAGQSDFPATPDNPEGAVDYQGARLFDAVIDGRPVRVASLQLPVERFGEAVTVQVAETQNKRRKLAREILASVLLPQIVLIGAASLMLWFGIRGGLAPLGKLAERLQAQDHRRPQPITVDDVPQEVQPLALALNDLLTRLESALAAQPQPCVRVIDDGAGIPEPLREQALKRFYRVDRSGSDGSGLGLAIVQEIVRSHGATLTLGDGLEGRGLSASIVFPEQLPAGMAAR